VRFFEIGLDQFEVIVDHIEGGVAQDALEGEDIPTVSEVFDRESVPEAVRMSMRHLGGRCDPIEQLADGSGFQAEQPMGRLWLLAAAEIEPEGFAGAFTQGDVTLFGFFAGLVGADVELTEIETEIGEG